MKKLVRKLKSPISITGSNLMKFIQIDIRDTDSYSDSGSLFQVIAHSNLILNNDSY